MAGKTDRKGAGATVIIKRFDIVEGGHHGGAWKVAYADFVTAMMAFFLLMWLLNATTQDQRKGLADYFSPNNLMSHASSGTGQPFGGNTALVDGAMVSDRGSVQITPGKRPTMTQAEQVETEVALDPNANQAGGAGSNKEASGMAGWTVLQSEALALGGRKPTAADLKAEKEREEKAAFEQAAEQIREAVRADPALAELGRQLSIDMTPEGLRIQIMDEIKLPMFASGSAAPNERARLLLRKVAPVLAKLPNKVSIDGHTDSAPFPGSERSNWDLSTERANTTRRLLVEGGLAEPRVRTVTGHADRDLLLPADPLAAANRRISIVMLRDAVPRAP